MLLLVVVIGIVAVAFVPRAAFITGSAHRWKGKESSSGGYVPGEEGGKGAHKERLSNQSCCRRGMPHQKLTNKEAKRRPKPTSLIARRKIEEETKTFRPGIEDMFEETGVSPQCASDEASTAPAGMRGNLRLAEQRCQEIRARVEREVPRNRRRPSIYDTFAGSTNIFFFFSEQHPKTTSRPDPWIASIK